MIKYVMFDLDDTLLDFHMAERNALAKTLQHFGITPTDLIIKRYSEINSAQWKLLEQGILSQDQIKLRRYELLFKELGVSLDPLDATKFYESQLGIGHYFIDGAENLLKKLYRNYELYLASNGTAWVQHSRIASAGIEKYFSGIFISQEIGFFKPCRLFFQHCFDKINGFCREQCAIVGDSLSSDIRGGLDAGITTIWYNPHCHENDSGSIPDYEINSLSQLPELLSAI